MKVFYLLNLVVLGSFLVCQTHTQQPDLSIEYRQSSTFNIIQNFREPKKILFYCVGGGSSHTHWVLSILNELNSRGHNTSYITMESHLKHSKNYPKITSISLGPDREKPKEITNSFMDLKQLDFKVLIMSKIHTLLKYDYPRILQLIKEEKYDVAICDSFSISCQEAAKKMKIPTIVTSSIPHSLDAAAPYINNDIMNLNIPTTEFMGFWERVNVKLIQPLEYMWKSRHSMIQERKTLKELDITASSFLEARWKDTMKMYNTAFGFQQGRPLGPLVEFVGPILNTRIVGLSQELEGYLNERQRVAYVAFGQHATLTQKETTLILTGLLESYEKNDIDGVIWATRDLDGSFAEYITTSSNTTYDVSKFFSYNESDIMFVGWAPQMFILSHPSTLLFFTHGGSASIYESLYAGVRMVICPFYGDQPGAAVTGVKNGYALRLDRKATQEEANEVISTIARDIGKTFQKNADRFKALVQIRSKHGIIKGADLVEEVAFLSVDGKLPHRTDVKHTMTFMKASNLDIYILAALVLSGAIYSLMWCCFRETF